MLIQSDYHIHASFYRVKLETDAPGPTAAEQVAAASNAGSVYIGILEHCNASSKHPFCCLEELSKEYYSPGFPAENVFLGVEADLNDDGSDFCGKTGREKLKLHYVIGSVHSSPAVISSFEEYLACEHRRIVNALKYNSNVDIIGHPFGEGKRWMKNGDIECWHWGLIPENYLEDILRYASETGKALEINRGNFDDPVYLDFLRRMRDDNIIFEAGSDAHNIGNCSKAALRTQQLEALGFNEAYHWKAAK